MLPDFRAVKRALAARLAYDIQAQASADPLLSMIPRHRAHGGDTFVVERSDGSVTASAYEEASTAFAIDNDRLKAGDHTLVSEALSSMAEQMTESASRSLFDELEKA